MENQGLARNSDKISQWLFGLKNHQSWKNIKNQFRNWFLQAKNPVRWTWFFKIQVQINRGWMGVHIPWSWPITLEWARHGNNILCILCVTWISALPQAWWNMWGQVGFLTVSYSNVLNRRPCTFISSKVCPIHW